VVPRIRGSLGVASVVLAATLASAATGMGTGSAGKPAPGRFLSVNAARRAITVTLIAADGISNNGFNFDDYGRGELLVSVPEGWRVTVRCDNSSSTFNSCVVVSGAGASAPAFPGATTPDPVTGLDPGQSAAFSFVATRVGSYRLASLVPGHEQARMWDVLVVTRSGRPSIVARPGP
jgi:hypothetical protein